ncbi:BREX system serine/threonine kinase PglW [Propioniciclava sp. MC1683]|uniref:BREX system serine/threonine kinase PglW n=1 Tax=Propioniciclava sp. MC1683 TaxID=2760309 RepID=UPI0015FF4E8B|nr:BREX system serine/threonine kinase PglW [Propioniciclava sp. MC1683]MBB1502070.1 BREX system serine/threonine kinase PglW [Propioniciclava sp. MC1683]
MADARWVEVTPSQFAYEAEGLRVVRDLLPNAAPYRAWSNFEFRDAHGNWAEVDLLVLAPDGLHLLELKYYSGRLRGNDQTWLRDGRRAEDSPLMLANRKAKRLRGKLMDAYDEWARNRRGQGPTPPARDVIPFIHAAVFLHHPSLVSELPDTASIDLYGLPRHEDTSNIAPITDLLDRTPRPGTTIHEAAIANLMQRIGVRAHERTVGSYVLDPQPFEDGPGWQDWLATHKLLTTQRRRIRFRVLPEGSTEDARKRVRLVAGHEMQVMQRLSHDAILRPEDFVDSELGPGLIYPYDPSWQRLDLWLSEQPAGFDFDAQLALIRQLAEALQYAHGKNVVHRRLRPRAVLVRTNPDGRLQARLTDWQGVGRTDSATSTQARGLTTLADADAAGILADDASGDPFSAPEGTTGGVPNRLRLDVFGLGALAFYLVTGGQPPAGSRAALIDRLRDQGGLDVSVELPAAPPALREAILHATSPRVSERLPDVGAFLAALEDAAGPAVDEVTDPLDATPGAILGGRFTLVRRLGAGSTAVGLLVTDGARQDSKPAVLKVALDHAAARRLTDEAEALARLSSPRIVKLLEGPLDVGGRRALLLDNAGTETLATHLGNRERLPLDWLERWGTDLLEALVTLDKAGIMHRDIKPANLGVRTDKSNRSQHLSLYDFSLTRAAASDTQAGTPPYLDPFLSPRRPYDAAAERYAAAVVLFEMSTGHTPVYGDGLSDPHAIPDEATVDPADFDPSARARLVAFFTRALARDAQARHDTADAMLLEWRACFPESSVPPVDADALAEQATADTPLAQSGLTPRAISAVEQLKVTTVGELAQVDLVKLNNLSGVARPTKQELTARNRVWRSKFQTKAAWRPDETRPPLPDPYESADLLLDAARGSTPTGRSDRAVALASLLLGVTGKLDANASQAELAAAIRPPVSRGRVSQLLTTLQDRWADGAALRLLDQLTDAVDTRLTDLGGVATFDELAEHLFTLMVARPELASGNEMRLTEGLLRCTVDRKAALERAQGAEDGEETGWFLRRRDGRMLVALRHDLLDVAEALGHRADALVAEANVSGTSELVPAARVADHLGQVLVAAEQAMPARAASPYEGLRAGRRLAHLGARLGHLAGASATGELHHRDLPAPTALRLALAAIAPGQTHKAESLAERVKARFPDLPALPSRPALDALVAESGLALRWDEAAKAYVAPGVSAGHTTGLTRTATHLTTPLVLEGPGAIGQRLLDSRDRRSFVALGVTPRRHDELVDVLQTRFDAATVDLTHTLIDALHDTAAAINLPWSEVLAADAGAPGSRAQQGLNALVQRSLPRVAELIESRMAEPVEALAMADEAHSVAELVEARPLVLTDASLLARHDALGLLAPWMDLATRRARALWLVVPQLNSSTGPMVDGRPLHLTAPNQFVPVAEDWILTQSRSNTAAISTPESRNA